MAYKICAECNKTYYVRTWSNLSAPICSTQCKKVRAERRRKKVEAICRQCGQAVLVMGAQLYQVITGRIYCSRACSNAFRATVGRANMIATNKKGASARMKARNPMYRPEIRAKVSASMQGKKLVKRGGNGANLPQPQALLLKALGHTWEAELIIPTRNKDPILRLPHAYKVDLGLQELKLAIEVDGQSHRSLQRQAQDKKKQQFLQSIGWTVLRFWNKQVMEHLEECVQTVLSTISKLKTLTPTLPTGS